MALCLALSAAVAYESVYLGSLPVFPGLDLAPTLGALLEIPLAAPAPAAVLLLVVAGVSFTVHAYSLWYMEGDPDLSGFFGLISLFTAAMALLALSGSLLTLFVGWEGIGVASYLLVSFWSTRAAALLSAVQAFLLNRAGDMALTLGLALALAHYGGLDMAALGLGLPRLEALGIVLLVAAAGKSAQLGLHAWLPNAMEAPTPVSALIHAATLVTAGVYLLYRCAPLVEGVSSAAVTLAALSTLFAGVLGLGVHDIKRVIAYSTLSQIALVLLAVGSGQGAAGMGLLALHAAYKALLFLGAGVAIHGLGGLQDLRAMGGLGRTLPLCAGLMAAAAGALGALPYTSGEFGKDLLIAGLGGRGIALSSAAWMAALLSVGLTIAYSVRLHRLAFAGVPRLSPLVYLGSAEREMGPLYGGLVAPLLLLLAACSLAGGYLLSGVFLPVGPHFGEGTPWVRSLDGEGALGTLGALAPYLAIAVGGFLGYRGVSTPTLAVAGLQGYSALSSRAYTGALHTGGACMALLDRGLFEAVGPYGVSSTLASAAVRIRPALVGVGLYSGVRVGILGLTAGALFAGALALA
jgi:NADH-quinone oxidoreductase subunit L